MRTIHVIGMGPGGAEYLTVQAIEALKKVDVFFLLDKAGPGKETLGDTRRRLIDQHRGAGAYRIVAAPSPPRPKAAEDYLDVVADWHGKKADILGELIAEHVADGGSGGILVWGDPALYDSSLAILRRLRDQGLDIAIEVAPGVTSLQLLAARHAIPLHEIGGDFLVTTARRLIAGAGADCRNIVVMLDSNAAFAEIDPQDFDIYWGAYLGTDNEVTMSGSLKELAPALKETVRREKERHGWILDIYLLRRRTVS